jgi:serine/threonine protein phosphatase PrpC
MAHIGDTRLYQYLHCEIKKLSHDHSLVGYREEVGELTEEEAMHHPQRNIIGRDMGSKYMEMNTDQVEMATFQLRANSILLLCSDGLSDMITSSMMSDILSTSMTLEEKAKGLVDKANSEGGKDNITVVLVEYTGEDFIDQEPSTDEDLVYAKEDQLQSSTNMQSHVANNYHRELSYIRSLLMVIVALLIIVLLGLGYVLYEVKDNAYKKESMSTQQTEEMISDTDSLQQQAEVPDNE